MIRKLVQQVLTLVMALVLAVFIWMYAYSQTSLRIERTLTVTVDESDADTQTMVEPKAVRVFLNGPRRLINQIATDQVAATTLGIRIPMSAPPDGQPTWTENIKLNPDHLVGVPPGVDVTFQPTNVDVTYLRNKTGLLPVRVVTRGEPASGYRIDKDNIRVSPANIEVTGPEKLFADPDKLPFVETAPVVIDPTLSRATTITPSAQLQTTVRLGEQNIPIRFSDERDRQVSIWIPIVPELVRRTYRDIPLYAALTWPFPNELKLGKETVTIKVQGTREELDKLKPEAIRAMVLVTEKVVSNTPYFGRVVIVFPSGVNVTLEEKPEDIPYDINSKEGPD